jgi:hypothetical protein
MATTTATGTTAIVVIEAKARFTTGADSFRNGDRARS